LPVALVPLDDDEAEMQSVYSWFTQFWILDFGFWIGDFGFWILDFGLAILDFGFWIGDFGF
jgi:hypothetical protein